MRPTILACVLVACAAPARPPARPPPAPSAAPAPAPAALPEPRERLVYAEGEPPRDHAIAAYIDPLEAKRVRTALFRKPLLDLADCPKRPFFEPTTWVDVDELQRRNLEAGLFVAVVEQRIEGSFTGPDEKELLFVVRVENCQSNTSGHRELAVFSATSPLGKPRLRWTENPPNAPSTRFLAVVHAEHGPARFLEKEGNAYRLVELNRPFVPGVPLRSSTEYFTRDGGSVVEPWSVVAEWPSARPRECIGFYAPETEPGTVRLATKPGACPP